jgi:hypothetical protein
MAHQALHAGSSSFCGAGVQRQQRSRRAAAPLRAAVLEVEATTTKVKKAETLAFLQQKVQPEAQIAFVAGINFKGFTVRPPLPLCVVARLAVLWRQRRGLLRLQSGCRLWAGDQGWRLTRSPVPGEGL